MRQRTEGDRTEEAGKRPFASGLQYHFQEIGLFPFMGGGGLGAGK